MTYDELIEKAIRGRSVNRAAKDMGINQRSLDRYAKGERLPDFQTALLLAREANISPGEMLLLLAAEEHRRKEMKEIVSAGFRLLTNALNRLSARLLAA